MQSKCVILDYSKTTENNDFEHNINNKNITENLPKKIYQNLDTNLFFMGESPAFNVEAFVATVNGAKCVRQRKQLRWPLLTAFFLSLSFFLLRLVFSQKGLS